MIKSQEQLPSIFNAMNLNSTFDFIPKFTKCIASYIGNCIDRIVRRQKNAITKRLQKRRHYRLFEGCKYRSDKIKCKCDCNRCTKYKRIPRETIPRTDFIMNYVCNNRLAKDVTLKANNDKNQMSSMENDRSQPWTLTQKRSQDHRDVQALDLKTGWEWWMKMQQSAACMPSLQHDAAAPTKSSLASSRSYSKSCNALTELNEEIDEMQTNSSINDQIPQRSAERREIEKHSQQPHEGSKSDSKIESGRDKTKCSSVFKSASTKTTCVRRSMNKRRNLVLTKQRLRKRRPCKTRSYRASCLGPSVRYFKNLSKKK